jgi:hypothetical protein
MRYRHAWLGFLALALSGCNLLNGKCTYEVRSVQAAGSIDQGGSEFVAVQTTLSEQRGSLQGQSIYWLITSSALKGHVLSASLKDSSNPSQVLLNLPLASADRPEISQGTAASASGANLGGFHEILAANHGFIELQTDLSGQLTVTVPLTATSAGDWIRPNCS